MTQSNIRKLPVSIQMRCHACESHQATYVCRFHIDDLKVQVCLCTECMKLDTQQLIKNTLGIEESVNVSAQEYMLA